MFLRFQENAEELKPQIAKLAAEELLLITQRGSLEVRGGLIRAVEVSGGPRLLPERDLEGPNRTGGGR